jgi:hypothetical protein
MKSWLVRYHARYSLHQYCNTDPIEGILLANCQLTDMFAASFNPMLRPPYRGAASEHRSFTVIQAVSIVVIDRLTVKWVPAPRETRQASIKSSRGRRRRFCVAIGSGAGFCETWRCSDSRGQVVDWGGGGKANGPPTPNQFSQWIVSVAFAVLRVLRGKGDI